MGSKLVVYTKTSPNSNPRKHSIYNPTGKILKITPHHAAGNASVESMGNIFASSARQASANYGVGTDGRIAEYVREDRRAWTSGSPENDYIAVTIEVANDGGAPDWHVSDKAMAALIDLCVDICKRNDIKKLNFTGDKNGNLTMHKMFQPTLCPGPYLESKFPYIASEVNKRLGAKEPEKKPATESYTLKQFVMDVQKATGAMVDGIPGPETLSKTPTLSAHINVVHAAVKPVQKRLAALGYTEVGIADGIAGPKFTSAVAHYQMDNKCVADGEITARNKTWKKLLGMA